MDYDRTSNLPDTFITFITLAVCTCWTPLTWSFVGFHIQAILLLQGLKFCKLHFLLSISSADQLLAIWLVSESMPGYLRCEPWLQAGFVEYLMPLLFYEFPAFKCTIIFDDIIYHFLHRALFRIWRLCIVFNSHYMVPSILKIQDWMPPTIQ